MLSFFCFPSLLAFVLAENVTHLYSNGNVTYSKIHITLIHCHNQFRFCSVTIIPYMDVHFIHLCFVWEALDVLSLHLANSRQQRGVNVRPPADPVDQIVIGQNITWTSHYKGQGKIERWTRHPGQDITWTKQTWTTQQATVKLKLHYTLYTFGKRIT